MSTAASAYRLDEPRPIALANTIWADRTAVHDALSEIAGVRLWLHAIGRRMRLTPPLGDTEVISTAAADRLRELRDAVRRLAAEQTHDPRSLGQSAVPDKSTAITIVNAAAAMSFVSPELVADDQMLSRSEVWLGGSVVDACITVIAREAIELMTGPQWQQLRPCVAPGCAYYFLKEHFRREWCSATCGNRARVARHAQRRRIQ